MVVDARVSDGAATRTVERALALLSVVCEHDEISLTEASRATGLAASTALRLLRTMEAAGYVGRDAEGSYRAGPRILQVGAGALGRNALARLAEPALDRIVAATGEAVYLSVKGPGDTAVYLATAEGTHAVRHTSWAGRSIPVEDLAVGVVLRGEVPPGEYLAQRDRREPDVTAICAPIPRLAGVVGALSILGPTYRIDEDRIREYGAILAREGVALGHALGAPPHRVVRHRAVGPAPHGPSASRLLHAQEVGS